MDSSWSSLFCYCFSIMCRTHEQDRDFLEMVKLGVLESRLTAGLGIRCKFHSWFLQTSLKHFEFCLWLCSCIHSTQVLVWPRSPAHIHIYRHECEVIRGKKWTTFAELTELEVNLTPKHSLCGKLGVAVCGNGNRNSQQSESDNTHKFQESQTQS